MARRDLWTDPMDAKLEKLFADPAHLTYREIAEGMKPFNVSRNACIGRVGRLGLKRSGNVPTAKKASERTPRQRMVIVKKPEAPAMIATVEGAVMPLVSTDNPGVEFSDPRFSSGCRAPLDKRGSDGLIMYCGRPKAAGCPYCPAHARLFTAPRVARAR